MTPHLRPQDRPLNTVHFESPSHTGTLLYGLNTLRSKQLLLDVTLVAGDEHFRAHRVVLASCSEYFRAMFTDAMKESRQDEICLNGVTSSGMKHLLEYAYTSRLSLNLANIQDILSAASHVQVFAVVEACSNYLQAQLDLDNCIDIATISETYSLHHLKKRVYRFMCANLSAFTQTADFQRLSATQLDYLLACDYPVNMSETQVLRSVLTWLHPDRLAHAPRLLAHIHYDEIPSDSMRTFMDVKVFREAVLVCQSEYRLLQARSESVGQLVNSRGMELALVKVGGFGINGITNEVTYFLPSASKWRHLTTIPHVEQCNFGTAVLNNELFVVGGCFNQSLQENIHPFGFRYSPRYNKWSTMAPMQMERCRFSLTVVEEQLYAIGGASETSSDTTEDISRCECYDPGTDAWYRVPPMPGNRSQHSSVAWKHLLFVCGGLDQDFVLDSLLCLDTRTSTWEQRRPMTTPRADHTVASYKGRLYVCGGWYEDQSTGNRVLADTVDEYDVHSDQWRVVTRVPTPRYHAGVVVENGRLCVVGGFHSDVMFDRATGIVECYDMENDKWFTLTPYPQDIWEHACVALYVPRCREDMDVLTLSQ